MNKFDQAGPLYRSQMPNTGAHSFTSQGGEQRNCVTTSLGNSAITGNRKSLFNKIMLPAKTALGGMSVTSGMLSG